nr:hypothetical protein [Gammaproteobacteria bacterium]
VQVVSIAKVASAKISDIYLTSLAGGDIAVVKNAQGDVVPKAAVYRVLLKPLQTLPLLQVTPGRVDIKARSESFLHHAYRSIAQVLVRELGF